MFYVPKIFIRTVAFNIYVVEMLFYDNSVLKMYLLNLQLNVRVKSLAFSYEYFFYLPRKTICRKHTTIQKYIWPISQYSGYYSSTNVSPRCSRGLIRVSGYGNGNLLFSMYPDIFHISCIPFCPVLDTVNQLLFACYKPSRLSRQSTKS